MRIKSPLRLGLLGIAFINQRREDIEVVRYEVAAVPLLGLGFRGLILRFRQRKRSCCLALHVILSVAKNPVIFTGSFGLSALRMTYAKQSSRSAKFDRIQSRLLRNFHLLQDAFENLSGGT